MSQRKWSAIHKEANVQTQCMTWLFAYFNVSWVVHGGGGGMVASSTLETYVKSNMLHFQF